MGFSTYTELKAALPSWLGRGSLPNGADDEFIDMAEAEFNRIIRNKELKASDTFTTTVSQETAILPAAAKLVISINHTDDNAPKLLSKVSEGVITDMNAGNNTDRPRYWCRGDGATSIRLARLPNAVYTLDCVYYKNITPLDDSNDSNWMLDNHPDLYLYTCLEKAAVRFVDRNRLSMFQAAKAPLMADFLKEIEEEKEAFNGTGQIKIKGGIA